MAGGVTLIFAVGQLLSALPGNGGVPRTTVVDVLLTVAAAALIMISGWSMRRRSNAHRLTWAVWPFACDRGDRRPRPALRRRSTAAQIFLIFPALYAASQLAPARRGRDGDRRGGGRVGDHLRACCRSDTALVDASYMTAAIVTTAALLTAAGERQEKLVALLERQAAIDPLTGLVTRRVLDDAASAAMSGAASEERHRVDPDRRRPFQGASTTPTDTPAATPCWCNSPTS